MPTFPTQPIFFCVQGTSGFTVKMKKKYFFPLKENPTLHKMDRARAETPTNEGTFRMQGKTFHLKYNKHITDYKGYLHWVERIGGRKINKVLKYSFGNETAPTTGLPHCHVLLRFENSKDITNKDHFTHVDYGKCHIVQVKTNDHFANCAKYCSPCFTNIEESDLVKGGSKKKELSVFWKVWNAFVTEISKAGYVTALGHSSLMVKRPRSKMTYMEEVEMEHFYNGIAAKYADLTQYFEKHKKQVLFFAQWVENIVDVIKNQVWENQDEEEFVREEVLTLPRVKLYYDIIEYGDFFYSIYLNKIIRTNTDHFCYYYCPHIKLSTMYDNLTRFIQKGKWCDILKRQKKFNLGVLVYLANILRPREFKSLILYLLSGPNAGKTTLLRFLTEIYPSDYVCYIGSEMSPRFLAKIRYAGVVIFEEANMLINSTMYYDLFLRLLEGGEVDYDEKYGRVGKAKIKCGMVMLGNYWCNDEFYSIDKKALSARIQPVNLLEPAFDFSKNNSVGIKANKAVVDESGLVVLLLGLAFITHEGGFSEFKAFDVLDSFSPADIAKLKVMRNEAYKLTEEEICQNDDKTMDEIMDENEREMKLAEERCIYDIEGETNINIPITRAFQISSEELGIQMSQIDEKNERKIHKQKIEEAKDKHAGYVPVDTDTTTVHQSKSKRQPKKTEPVQ